MFIYGTLTLNSDVFRLLPKVLLGWLIELCAISHFQQRSSVSQRSRHLTPPIPLKELQLK